ncbi:phage protease [Pandoraea apista]|uniref:phage protease n=1 Tax=Pandoraea apista TaxID=93218 RepID=UPI00058AA4ED|nr:phage protease [Pandoraea apista]AJF00056.1 Mu-like prophage FluMu I protein [Pandoraea apista]AKH74211.1 Mu-like prophage FluMu I protein [Pandoraea apista]AKI62760.1 Mu-like prophage FluMu I protein [Pandoraea apista]
MNQKHTTQTAVAALALELVSTPDGGVPTEAQILPPGPFRALDGRPFDCAAWQLDATIAAGVISLAAQRQNDILIDFDHQSLNKEKNGQRAEAAGWIPRTLEWREGKGLVATNISWVGDTAELITSKKYRYISAVFFYSPATGAVLEIISVALTNTPALDGLEALAALARKHTTNHERESEMSPQELAALTIERDDLKSQLAALTAERDGLQTNIAALTAERDGLKSTLDAIEREKVEAALTAEKSQLAELVQAALSDGRLAPAQKPWAEKQTLATLTEFLDASKPLSLLEKQAGKENGGADGLTPEELAMCTRMGVTPEQYREAQSQKSA